MSIIFFLIYLSSRVANASDISAVPANEIESELERMFGGSACDSTAQCDTMPEGNVITATEEALEDILTDDKPVIYFLLILVIT